MSFEDELKVMLAGGQAFPGAWQDSDGDQIKARGMTLRDWFAGQALVGLLTAPPTMEAAELAREAYRCADAMLLKKGADDDA